MAEVNPGDVLKLAGIPTQAAGAPVRDTQDAITPGSLLKRAGIPVEPTVRPQAPAQMGAAAPAAGPAPTLVTTTMSTPTSDVLKPTAIDPNASLAANAGAAVGNLYYRSVGRWAAAANALLLKVHNPYAKSPAEYAKTASEAGFPTPVTPVPEGALATAGTALNAAGPVLAAGTPVFSAIQYGVPSAIQYFTGDEATADAFEGYIGAVGLASVAAPVVTSGLRSYQRAKGVLPQIEKQFVDATGEAEATLKAADEARKVADAQEAAAKAAEANLHAAKTAHEAAVDELRGLPPVPEGAPVPGPNLPPTTVRKGDLLTTVGQPEVSPQVAGQALTAVGHQSDLLTEVTGMESGGAISTRVNATRDAHYDRLRELSYKGREGSGPTMVPLVDGPAVDLQQDAAELAKELTEKGASPVARKVALALADLRSDVQAGLGPNGEIIVKKGSVPSGADGGAPYSKVLDLYASLRQMTLDPSRFGLSKDVGLKRATLLVSKLGQVLRVAEHETGPEMAEAGRAARAFVNTRQVPWMKQTYRLIASQAKTAAQVAGRVLNPLYRDPTHLEHILANTSPLSRDRYIASLWTGLMEHASDGKGNISWDKLERTWNSVHPRVKDLLSSQNNGKSALALEESIGNYHTSVASARDVHTAAVAAAKAEAERLGTAAKTTRTAALGKVQLAKATRSEAHAAYATATKRANAAVKAAARAFEKGQLKTNAASKIATERPGYFSGGRYGNSRRAVGGAMTAYGAFQVASGNVPGALFHLFMGTMMMRRPLTLAESLRTPAESFAGRRLVAALQSSWNAVQGQWQQPDGAAGGGAPTGQSPTPPGPGLPPGVRTAAQ